MSAEGAPLPEGLLGVQLGDGKFVCTHCIKTKGIEVLLDAEDSTTVFARDEWFVSELCDTCSAFIERAAP